MISYVYPGSLSIAELQTQIQYAEQSKNLNLVAVHVMADKQNMPRTVCDYKEVSVPLGDSPSPTFLVKHGDAQPTGTTSLLFTDIVVAENSFVDVDFYR